MRNSADMFDLLSEIFAPHAPREIIDVEYEDVSDQVENKPDEQIYFCGECVDFLYEGCSGYGICAQDNDNHSCNEKCIYGKTKPKKI